MLGAYKSLFYNDVVEISWTTKERRDGNGNDDEGRALEEMRTVTKKSNDRSIFMTYFRHVWHMLHQVFGPSLTRTRTRCFMIIVRCCLPCLLHASNHSAVLIQGFAEFSVERFKVLPGKWNSWCNLTWRAKVERLPLRTTHGWSPTPFSKNFLGLLDYSCFAITRVFPMN